MKVRRIATPAGEKKYGAPIGTPIKAATAAKKAKAAAAGGSSGAKKAAPKKKVAPKKKPSASPAQSAYYELLKEYYDYKTKAKGAPSRAEVRARLKKVRAAQRAEGPPPKKKVRKPVRQKPGTK